MGLDDGADVGGELRVLVLAAAAAPRGEVLQASHPLLRLVESLGDRVPPPAEAAFGLAGVTVANGGGDLGDEGTAAEAGQPLGAGTDQSVERFRGGVHAAILPGEATRKQTIMSQNSTGPKSRFLG